MTTQQEEFGRRWIECWNSRDLERILTLYDDDAEMSSPVIVRRGINAEGQVKGKAALRAYWGRGLKELPDLHFTLLDIFASPDSLIVRYRNERGHTICEYLRLNGEGKIVQGSANHLVE